MLYAHIKQLYQHNKTNIKMLDFDEYQKLCTRLGLTEPNLIPTVHAYCIEMMLVDSRFDSYDLFFINCEKV